jgi:hypothetical protein
VPASAAFAVVVTAASIRSRAIVTPGTCRLHDACKIVCRAGQAYPDKQQILVGVLAAFVQPEQHGDRDICGCTPGAAFVSPGEVINVRLEDI